MTKQSYHTTTIDLHIVYDGSLYFYNRTENGRLVINSQRIDAERGGGISSNSMRMIRP